MEWTGYAQDIAQDGSECLVEWTITSDGEQYARVVWLDAEDR